MATRDEVRRFDPSLPVERAWTPPASWYTDPKILELERDTVFARTWFPACRADQVRRDTAYVAGSHCGQPWFVQRGDDGVLRAFHNACRHHATRLFVGEGCAESIRCPYHSWTYDLDGALRSAPRMGGVEGFDREHFGLHAIRVETWSHWVFLCFDDEAPGLSESLGPLASRFTGSGQDALAFAGARSYEVGCNWKVFVDNYLDGGYHVPFLHPSLAESLDTEGYRTELEERAVLQSCGGAADERVGTEALYGWFHPAFMLNRYGGVLDANIVRPIDAERCEVLFEWYVEEGVDVEACIAASEQVQVEDIEVSESVQAGLRSPSYDRGRYAPRVEHGMYRFHQLLAADLLSPPRGATPHRRSNR